MKYIKKFKIHPNIYQWHILYRWIFLCTIFIHPQNRRIISQKSRHACLVTRICVLAWRNRLTLWWGKAGTSESLWSTTTTSATQSTSSIIPDINLVIVLSIMDFSFAMQVLEIFIIDVYRKVRTCDLILKTNYIVLIELTFTSFADQRPCQNFGEFTLRNLSINVNNEDF